MRALSILIKRQIIDDAPFFVSALVASGIIVLLLGCLAFIYPEDLLLQMIAILISLPALVGLGFFAFGVAQTYIDRTNEISEFLSALPVKRSQILTVRIIVGILVTLTVLFLLALAITGGVLSGLLLWPDSLLPGGLFDLFIGMFLIAFSCYCLGLSVSHITQTLTGAMCVLPLVVVIVLLIVVKGLGWPLIVIALPLITASLLSLMRTSAYCPITVIATGFMVLVLLATPLHWGRYMCDVAFVANMPIDAHHIRISPSGLLPFEYRFDPNSHSLLTAVAGIESFYFPSRRREVHYILGTLGIIDYIQSREPGGQRIRLGHFGTSWDPYFDKGKGLLVDRDNSDSWHRLYIGPEGMSTTPDTNLGRFKSPVIAKGFVYDREYRCFFALDLKNQTIRKGPVLNDITRRPIDIIASYYRSEGCSVYFSRPYGGDMFQGVHQTGNYLPVLDESGRIDLLDTKKLELVGYAGTLPRPQTLFGWGSRKPNDLLAYDIEIIATGAQQEYMYIGMIAASLSRQGTSMTLAVFDKEGKEVRTAQTRAVPYEARFSGTGLQTPHTPSAKAILFDVPWGPEMTMTKYLLESLHPPVLTLASFFTAYSFEAGSTHRALFLMPNSFMALLRDREGSIISTFLIALLIILPAFLFAGFLGWLVVRDALVIGLSRNSRRIWLLGTLAFGLTAYITYRLTRPKITLVTCQNCGKMRRPDMAKCHRCKSDWHVPELTPPAWRVLKGAEQVHEGSTADAAETVVE